MTPWSDAYERHFLEYFGKPFDIQQFYDNDNFALKLATYDWALKGFRVYASLGMATRLALEGEQAVREVILYSDVPDQEVPRLFVASLFFILQNAIPLTTRFSVVFPSMYGTFSRRYGKTALYFTRAFSADGEFDKVAFLANKDELARVYQAFFITPDEDEFLENEGPVAFEQRFWSQFGGDFRRDEPLRQPVDMEEMPHYQMEVKALWKRAAQLFSVRRPSCV
jgi:hypothetical protein